jgi:hypothetical protein
MEIGSVLVITAIMFIVAFYLAIPILQGSGKELTNWERRVSSLQARREQVLSAIQDLDLDRTMGKIEKQDYMTQRAALAHEGASILRELDALEEQRESKASTGGAEMPPLDAASLKERLQVPEEKLAGADEAQLEEEIRAARARLTEPESNFCTQCGSEILPADRFCSNCGAPVGQERSPV